LLFVRHGGSLLFVVFNRCPMGEDSNGFLSCLERERLDEELSYGAQPGEKSQPTAESDAVERTALERARAGGADTPAGP